MLNLKHGGHILDDNAPGAEETTRKDDSVILAKNALLPFRASPEELAKFQAAETQKWGRIIKTAGIQPE